jgi:hypothetical protein
MTPIGLQISRTAAMRANIALHVTPADRKRLEDQVADRNTPAKVVWRAEIMLATADGLETMAILRRSGKSKPCVWRWQERFAAEGVEGLIRDKTRPSRKVLSLTAREVPPDAKHWSARSIACGAPGGRPA